MKTIRKISKPIALLLITIVLFSSCASTTVIESYPSKAKVYINGEAVGTTPYTMQDTKIVGTCSLIRLEKDGHEVLNTSICRNEEVDIGAIVGGCFFLFPFLWTMKYKPVHTYNLEALPGTSIEETTDNSGGKSKTERILELHSLLEKNIITQEEFETEKQKILKEK